MQINIFYQKSETEGLSSAHQLGLYGKADSNNNQVARNPL